MRFERADGQSGYLALKQPDALGVGSLAEAQLGVSLEQGSYPGGEVGAVARDELRVGERALVRGARESSAGELAA